MAKASLKVTTDHLSHTSGHKIPGTEGIIEKLPFQTVLLMECYIVLVRDLNTRQCQTCGKAIPAALVLEIIATNILSINTHHNIYKIQGLKLRPKEHSASSMYLHTQLLIWNIILN